jgi:hypothetical protein
MRYALHLNGRLIDICPGDVSEALAKQLGFGDTPMYGGVARVIDALVPEIEQSFIEGDIPWEQHDENRAAVLLRKAVDLLYTEEAIEAIIGFGWGRMPTPKNWVSLNEGSKDLLVMQLTPKLFRVLDKWLVRDAWNPEIEKGYGSFKPRPMSER